MNFKITGKNTFQAGINTYTRNYSATYKRNGKIKITSFLDGSILLDNLTANSILIGNEPFTHIEDLQKILFNKTCTCDFNTEDEKIKIFDGSFDQTFE